MGSILHPPPLRFDTKDQILKRGQKQNPSSKIRRFFSWFLGEPLDRCKHCLEYGGVWILEENKWYDSIDIYIHCEKCNKTHTAVRHIPRELRSRFL